MLGEMLIRICKMRSGEIISDSQSEQRSGTWQFRLIVLWT